MAVVGNGCSWKWPKLEMAVSRNERPFQATVHMYLDLGRWINMQGLHGAGEWTGLKGLAYSMTPGSRIDLLCCSVTIHFKGTWETTRHFV